MRRAERGRPAATGLAWAGGGLLAAALCLAVAACASQDEKLAEHLERAARYEEAGETAEAVIELKNALQLDPRSAETNFRLAELELERENYGDALYYYEEAHRLSSDRVDAALGATRILLGANPEEARSLLEEALERQPENAELQVRRSQLAVVGEGWEEALEAAGRAAELDPESPAGPLQLGRVHLARARSLPRGTESAELVEHLRPALRAFESALERAEGGGEEAAEDAFTARLARARTLGAWPEQEERAAEAFRSLLEGAAPTGEGEGDEALRRAGRAALRFARRAEDRELRRLALRRLVEVAPEETSRWGALARLEESDEEGAGEAVLARMLEQRPEDPEAHLLYARYLVQHERVEEALAHLEREAARGVDPPRLLSTLAEIQYRRAGEEDAEETLDSLQEEHPESLEAKLTAAQQTLRDGEVEEAAKALRRITEDHESSEAQRLLALAELRLGNLEASTRAIERALELAEGFEPATHRLRLRIQRAAGEWRGVLRTLRVLARRGAHRGPPARVMQARALYELGYDEQGRKVLDALLEGEEPPRGAVLLFARRERERDPAAVRRVLEAALERSPGEARFLAQLAALDREEEGEGAAFARLDAAIEAAEEPEARLLLLRARMLERRGELAEAESDLQRILEEHPDVPAAHRGLARLYRKQGKLDSAIASLQEAAEEGALGARSRVILGSLLMNAGRGGEALESLEAALREDDDLHYAKSLVAYMLAKRREDLDRALSLAQEAQAELDESPRAAEILGFVMLRKGLAGAAREQFEHAVELARERGRPTARHYYHLGLALRALDREEEATQAFEAALASDEDFPEAPRARRQLDAARAAVASAVLDRLSE